MKINEDLTKLTTTQRNLAKSLKLSHQRVAQLINEGIVIRDSADIGGGVLVLESIRNYYSRKATSTDGSDVDINRERALHEKAKRQLAELRLEKAIGNVYDSKIVERVITDDLVKLRTRLLTLPSKLAPTIEGKSKGEIDQILTREIEDCLSELSQFDPSVFMGDVEDEEDDAE